MAAYLLKGKPGWTEEKIRVSMNGSIEKWVTFDEPVPIYITYFTAWLDKDGGYISLIIFMGTIKNYQNTCFNKTPVVCWLMLLFSFLFSCKKKLRIDSFDEVNFSLHERNFGASAAELLKSDKFTSLAVEMQYMKGFKPDAIAVANLKLFLLKHLNKPDGIIFYLKEIQPGADTVLSQSQVDEIRRKNRTIFTKGKRIAIYILYTNAQRENPHILGQAFRHTSIVIYGKPVKAYGNVFSFPGQTTIETNLLLHEMGHILGLVDKGSNMIEMHADSSHEDHCNNPDCVMYWSMSIKPEFGPRMPHTIKTFDAACLHDLSANGGK